MIEVAALGVIFLIVLTLPFAVRAVERNLELFLLVSGIGAATVTGSWDRHLIEEALMTPLPITAAVMGAGSLVFLSHRRLQVGVRWLGSHVSVHLLIFTTVVVLGLISSIITAIIASIFLVTVLELLPLDRRSRVNVAIVACFAIGMGAVLTPVGEPLSSIAMAKLKGPPHHADFFFFIETLGPYVIPGVIALGVFALTPLVITSGHSDGATSLAKRGPLREVWVRAARVFVFVMALVLLGTSFEIIIERYFVKVPAEGLYWLNSASAILDNATVAAAEIGPALSLFQIKAIMIALMVSGGMLIPGNIPNILAAHKLHIGMREWARLGVPLGAVMMVAYFVVLFLI